MKYYMCIIIIAIVLCVYLLQRNNPTEPFSSSSTSTSSINNSPANQPVDMPFTSATTCSNFCGPTATCSVTGEQCSSDLDCSGCSSTPNTDASNNTTFVVGANDAGKLTMGVTPTYSSLTSGYGTREKIITDHMYQKPPQASFGANMWKPTFTLGEKLFKNRYNQDNNNNQTPNYPYMYSITGEFTGNGPMPANY